MKYYKKRKFKIKDMVIRLLITLLILAVIVTAFYLLFYFLGWTDLTKEELQDAILKTGPWGPLVFILLSFLQVTFIPIPSTVTIVAGSYCFGAGLSFLYSYIGIFIGSLFAFFLGRKIGRKFVNWIVGDAKTVDYYLNKAKGKEKVVLFFMFLFPFFPDDALCGLAGILPISYLSFIIMQLITRATSIGANILFLSGEFIPFSGWGIPVIIVLSILGIAAFIVSFIYSDKINAFFDKFVIRISNALKGKSKKEKYESDIKKDNEGRIIINTDRPIDFDDLDKYYEQEINSYREKKNKSK